MVASSSIHIIYHPIESVYVHTTSLSTQIVVKLCKQLESEKPINIRSYTADRRAVRPSE